MKKIGALVIVFSMLFTITIAPIFANEGSVNLINNSGTFVSTDNGNITWLIQGTALKPFMFDSSIATAVTGSANSTYINHYGNFTVAQDFIFLIRIINTTNNAYACNRGFLTYNFTTSRVYNMGTISYTGSSIELLQGDLLTYINSIEQNGYIQLRWNDNYSYNSQFIIPPKSTLYTNIIVRLYYDPLSTDTQLVADNYSHRIDAINLIVPDNNSWSITNNYVIRDSDYNSIEQNEILDDIYNQLISLYTLTDNKITATNNILNSFSSANHTDLVQIHNDLQSILDAYTTNSSNVSETQDNIDNVISNEQQLHQAEQNFYQLNEQALNNVGLSNFSFSSDQSSGLGSVITDFTTLWNNIGPLQIIFTFTLSMSLATFLLRHKPITGAIKKNQKR